MKIEIPKKFSDISSALTTECYWSGSVESGRVVSNVSVFFNKTQEEKLIRGARMVNETLSVILIEPLEPIESVELSADDIVYVGRP